MSDEPETIDEQTTDDRPRRGRPASVIVRNSTRTRLGLIANASDTPIFIQPNGSEKIDGSRWNQLRESGAIKQWLEKGVLQVT